MSLLETSAPGGTVRFVPTHLPFSFQIQELDWQLFYLEPLTGTPCGPLQD